MASDSTRNASPPGEASWDAETARRHASSLARWISLGSLGLMLCLWVAIILSNASVLDSANRRARVAASNLAAAFCLDVKHTLDTIDAAIDLTAREIRVNPKDFSLDRWAKELPALAYPAIYVTWIDAHGRLVSTTMKTGVSGIDFSDREHIRVHFVDREHDPGLFVSTPVIGRISGRETLQVTKRVDDAAGNLLGILVFILSAEDVTQLHRFVDFGPRGVIVLSGLDGRVRARFDGTPEGAPSAIKRARDALWPASLIPGPEDRIATSSAVDGVSRIYALTRLPAYGLFVAAGLSVDDALSDARLHAAKMIGIGIAASLLLGVLNILLLREIRQRGQREQELAHERETVEGARAALVAEQSKLAAMNRELVISSQRAEAASLAKSAFLAQMSHELRTPLHAVIGFSELIAHHAQSLPGAAAVTGYARDITRSGRHLLDLINSILDLSKVESGTATLTETVVPLADIVEDSVTTVRERAREGGVSLVVQLPANAPRVVADATRLRQIFINLLSNAVKFTPRGGSVSVAARVLPDGDYDVSVADTGIGMTESELAVALEPFGQVENSFSRSFEGTGLGLPLARHMVEMHGGRLTLHSVKGVGTTVEVVLPGERVLWPDVAAARPGSRSGGRT